MNMIRIEKIESEVNELESILVEIPVENAIDRISILTKINGMKRLIKEIKKIETVENQERKKK